MKLKHILSFLIFISMLSDVFSQTLNNKIADIFIKDIINESSDLNNFLNPEESVTAERLGITYRNVKHKFLIGNDIPDEIKSKIKSGEYKYRFFIEPLEFDYFLLKFSVAEVDLSRKYYFQKDKLISAEKYFSKDWPQTESEYFIFHYPDSILINPYSIKRLDLFVQDRLTKDDFNGSVLKEKKIHYYLCKDQDEIEKLTGYKSRGMCNLAYDYIISTYNFHTHEIIHLLVNYELKNLSLYTHPLLQEGYAVMQGGRGGLDSYSLTNSGYYLIKNGYVKMEDFFSRNYFISEDASISYSVASLFNLYLISELKSTRMYLKLYSENSFDNPEANEDVICYTPFNLDNWNVFLAYYKNFTEQNKQIIPSTDFSENSVQIEYEGVKVYKSGNYFYFNTPGDLLISDNIDPGNYKSGKFSETYPNKDYKGEHYLLRVNKDEISLYDLFLNALIAQYSSGFSAENIKVKEQNGYFVFAVSSKLFDFSIFDKNIVKISLINLK
jgi:hypothetical protein